MPSALWCGGLRCDGLQLAESRKACESLPLELANALPRQVELVPDRLERPGLTLEPEPQLEDPPLPLGQRVERAPHALAPERLLGLVERIGSLPVREQVAQLSLVVGADRLVERHRCLRGAERLIDVLD